jgi:pyridoxal phosphate enzyme (YggS family)
MSIAARLAEVRAGIAAAAARAGRPASSVVLVAVSKGIDEAALREAYEAGQRDFGESYVPELQAKRAALETACPALRWHFIGRVQRNKAQHIARTVLVHGVSSTAHAEALAAKRPHAAPLPILLQVNAAGEETKNGFSEAELTAALPELLRVEGVVVQGLMTLPPPGESRPHFAALRALRDALVATHGHPLPELSMGMSSDFEEAVHEGATLVRVGTTIFGARAKRTG